VSARLVPELLCSNLKASVAFHVDLVGFTVAYDRPEEGFAYLDLEGSELMLDEAPEETGDERVWWTARPEKPYGRGINFQIEVSDVDAIHDRLKEADWPLFRPMEEQWYRKDESEVGNRQFLVQDPDGYLFRFFSDLGERPAGFKAE
jgi:catechol 2,3-dioxygenase-like lactoylglutathione lyase family enzyme